MLCDQIIQAASGSETTADEALAEFDASLLRPVTGDQANAERRLINELKGVT